MWTIRISSGYTTSSGIYTIDLHEGNIGVNDAGQPTERAVIFDIGKASTDIKRVPVISNPRGVAEVAA